MTRNWNSPFIWMFLWLSVLSGACTKATSPAARSSDATLPVTLMTTGQNLADNAFLLDSLKTFGERNGINIRTTFATDTVDTHLRFLQDLFAKRSPEPDICEIDNIWPGLLADDLLDLKPYLDDELAAIDKSLLDVFMVSGRQVALPEFIEMPVLYYRTDLLAKYGYTHPPRTWDELGRMAKVIQDGERQAGSADFWGYLWQGEQGEPLNCNAMEWQRADGANLFDSAGKVCAYSPAAEAALRRARAWVGTISPPSVIEYDEEDVSNGWLAGSAMFARGWLSMYQPSKTSPRLAGSFSATALPAGSAGYAWTFGGMGWAISRYSAHPKEAAAVLRYLVSFEMQRKRLIASSAVPSRTGLLQEASLFRNSAFNGWLSRHWQEGLFARPSAVTGKKYDAVSHAYAKAVHDVIAGKQDAHKALVDLQTELAGIMR